MNLIDNALGNFFIEQSQGDPNTIYVTTRNLPFAPAVGSFFANKHDNVSHADAVKNAIAASMLPRFIELVKTIQREQESLSYNPSPALQDINAQAYDILQGLGLNDGQTT